MLIVNNVVKRGIEVPELIYTLSEGNLSVTVSAIDKIKYAKWLELNPQLLALNSDGEFATVQITGDELTVTVNDVALVAYCSTIDFIEL